jgi:hypothetical protein
MRILRSELLLQELCDCQRAGESIGSLQKDDAWQLSVANTVLWTY